MDNGIIYKATGPTGKIFIGQTMKTLTRRKSNHAYCAKKNYLRTVFQIALLEHGVNAFAWERIDTAETTAELDEKEKRWIAHYKADDPAHGYNQQNGGKHYTSSHEHRRKIGDANRRRVITDATRQKLR